MNFLAFDIEAANGYKPYSICSVGYVLADEAFNIIKKHNIWINPCCKYNLNGTRKNIGLDLHLDSALLERSPVFADVYEQIKDLLTDPNVRVVGHAVESDVLMLNKTCLHYKLPCINFDFVCSQLLFKIFKGERDVRGLSKIAEEIDLKYNAHTSDEDAYASLMTLKYLTEVTQKSLDQLLAEYNVRIGQNNNFVITRTVSLTGQINRKQITKQAVVEISNYIRKNRLKAKGKPYSGKLFCLSRQIEAGGRDVWQPVVDYIYDHGGQYATKIGKCDFYVFDDGVMQSQSDATRRCYAENLIKKNGKKINIITLKDLFVPVEVSV